MNGVEDEVGTMGGETRIYLLPSGALRSLDFIGLTKLSLCTKYGV